MQQQSTDIWQEVPARICQLFSEALPVASKAAQVVDQIPYIGVYGQIFYNPITKQAELLLGEDEDPAPWKAAWPDLEVIYELPPSDRVLIKDASADAPIPRTPIGDRYRMRKDAISGYNPLVTSIVGSLLAGGTGYLGGTILENLFPKRFVDRGRLRKTLGIAGLGLGALPGALKAYAHRQSMRQSGKPHGWLKALTTPDENVPVPPAYHGDQYNTQQRDKIVQASELLRGDLPELERRSVERIKEAAGAISDFGGIGLRSIPVDAFNRAIWNDVAKGVTARNNPYGTKSPWGDNSQPMHTPPNYGAAASGITSGVQSMFGGQSVLSPRHFVKGLAAAGTDLATAHIAGGMLGALGGITPEAQEKLQNIGLWGGFIRGAVDSVFGN